MKKTVKKLVLAKETVKNLEGVHNLERAAGGLTRDPNEKSVYWSCVCTASGMYTCEC